MKALIVDAPWIDAILEGRKDWEMRTRALRLRGRVGLIRKGSGTVVGVTHAVDSLPPLDPAAYAANEGRHAIPPARQAAAIAGGWLHPWVFSGTRALARPVPYVHRQGAVIWVNLPEDVAAEVERVLAGTPAAA